jgi:hypothetical protein
MLVPWFIVPAQRRCFAERRRGKMAQEEVVQTSGGIGDGTSPQRARVESAAPTPIPQYEPNPKHKPLPTPGRRGSICPQDVDADALLSDSELHGKKRYATNGSEAFCAQCHDVVRNLWHGYPVSWAEVPPGIRNMWVGSGKVSSRTIRRDRRRLT